MRTKPAAPLALAALLFLFARSPLAAEELSARELLAKLVASEDPEVRIAARSVAAAMGASAVGPLSELLTSKNLEAARTARAALERLVHHAGRPGGEAERGPVTEALRKALLPGSPAAVKRELLHQIAYIGSGADVSSVASFLDDSDPTVAEEARLVLERIPGKEALEALLRGARYAPEGRKPDIIFSIAKKGDLAAAKELATHAASDNGAVRLAAAEALARLGAPEGVALIAGLLEKAPEGERARIHDEALRLADNLRGSDPAAARAIYLRTLEATSAREHQREHALGALCPSGKSEAMPTIIRGLTDTSERVRRVAVQRLAALQGEETGRAIAGAYEEAKGSAKPLLLAAVAGRDAAAARPLVERAAESGDPELKIVALDLLGKLNDPRMEPAYLHAAESGAEWLKPIGLRGLLAVAKGRPIDAEGEKALASYEKVLDLAREVDPRLQALQGLIAVGSPASLDRLEGLLKDPQLGSDAARGYVTLAAAAGKKDPAAAEKRLLTVALGDFPRELKEKAIGEIRSLGIDPQRTPHFQGFLVRWWAVTPLPNIDGKGLERKDFPEEVIELEKEHRVGERKFRWQRTTELSLDGKVDLIPLFRKSENLVTYCYAELDSPEERDVLLKMGSDDGIACWINGTLLLRNNASRGYKLDEDQVKGHLAKGKNKVLVKISQKDGDWAFSFRITDGGGKPIDVGGMVGKG